MDWAKLEKRVRRILDSMRIFVDTEDIVQDVHEWMLTHTDKQKSRKLRQIVIDVIRVKLIKRRDWAKGERSKKFQILKGYHGRTPPFDTTLLDFDLIFDQLTEQDQYLLCRLLQGATNLEIADELDCHPSNVCILLPRLYSRIKRLMTLEHPNQLKLKSRH